MDKPDNKRLFLAVTLAMGILIAWQLWFLDPPKPPQDGSPDAPEATAADADTTAAPESTDHPTPPAAEAQALSPEVEPIQVAHAAIETEAYRVVLTSVGARAAHFELRQPERYASHGDYFAALMEGASLEAPPKLLPFGTELKSLGLTESSPFALVNHDDEEVRFRWRSPDGATQVDKRFVPGDSAYALRLELSIHNLSERPLQDVLSLSLYGRQLPGQEPGLFSRGAPVSAKCLSNDSVESIDKGDDPETYNQSVEWIAVDEPYFALVSRSEERPDACLISSEADFLSARLTHRLDLAPGEQQVITYEAFLGPKEDHFLKTFGHGIERTIDYGWVEILARPMAWLLTKFHAFFGNWGLAIILLTVLIRGALWPVTQRSQESMMRMQKISPKLQELQKQYKNDPQTLQQKQLQLYKEHKVNPFGCLPLFLQIPIWFALYRTIYVTGGLYRAEFGLWIRDLSAPDPYFVLPVLAGALFFLQQKLSPSTVQNVQQKVMLTVFPLVFVVVMLFLPSGLNLYILVSSVIGLLQALYTRKKMARRGDLATASGPAAPESTKEPVSAKERRAARRRSGTPSTD